MWKALLERFLSSPVKESLIGKVIVGLGNPGSRYAKTRHNIGWMVVQALANEQGWKYKTEKCFCAEVAIGRIGDNTVHLLLPHTYMNLSGQALQLYLKAKGLTNRTVCIVCDDIYLPFGETRIRPTGSSGGHNGLKSIEACLQSQDYWRLRIGIGQSTQKGQPLADYVLENFSEADQIKLPEVIQRSIQILMNWNVDKALEKKGEL